MSRTLPLSSKLSFGVGQAAEGVMFATFSTFTLFFYNQILEVPGTLTGIALGIALFCDAITDPVAGSISDRLQTRWGRRHPLMALSAAPLGLCLFALFNPPAGMGPEFYFGWLVAFAVLARLFLTLYHIPHLALGAEMTEDYVERTRVFAFSQFFGVVGNYGFAFLMLTLFFPTTEEVTHGLLNQSGYLPFSLAGGLIILVSIALCVRGTAKEIPHLPVARFHADERFSPRRLAREVRTAFRNRSYRMLFAGLVCSIVLLGIESNFMVYMYVHFWGLPTESMRWIGPAHVVALPISVAIAPWLTRNLDKRRTLILLAFVIIVANNAMITLRLFTDLTPDNGTTELLITLLSFVFVAGLCSPAIIVTVNSMFADIADQQELITGERQEGIIFSARSFAFKAGGSLATILAGAGLDLINFPRGAAMGEAPPEVVFNLGLIAGPLTSVIGLLLLFFYLGYRLDRQKMADIQAELAQRRA